MELRGIQLLTLCLAVCISVGLAKAPKKIINGQRAQKWQFRHQVSLQAWNQHYCGGTIIDATHILTAAHCVVTDKLEVKPPINDIRVITGVIDYKDRNENNVFRVYLLTYHRQYKPKFDKTHDIAILTLARRIEFNLDQQPIFLPTEDTPVGTRVEASGWGLQTHPGRYNINARYLQELPMNVISLTKCRKSYIETVDDGEICVQSARGTGMCTGDSGGPLTYKNTVIGIASRVAKSNSGISCATGYPDIYTRVYNYVHWIKKVIRKTSLD